MRERPMFYRLNDDHSVTPIMGHDDEDAALEWGRQFERWEDRQMARDDIGGCLVSTVFLGLDHGFGMGPPLLFETMAFSAASKKLKLSGDTEREVHEELEQRRYSTYDEAMRGHAEVVKEVRATVEMMNAVKGRD
jgi:hypothetical protein